MARYIDADWIYEKVENRYRVSNGIEHRCERDLLDLICEAPTADVVPKSEYDEVLSSWQKIHDSYDADCIEHYKYGRAEVAREIFEEIEKLTPKKFTEKSQDFEFGYALAIQQIKNKIAELKKKYTEDKDEQAPTRDPI